mgnify:CR=1 FL=1
MKRILNFLRVKLPALLLVFLLGIPVLTTLTACGDEPINGPRLEEDVPDPNDREGGSESD